jgi:hypothetical protein
VAGDVREAADHPGDLQTNTGAYLSRRKQVAPLSRKMSQREEGLLENVIIVSRVCVCVMLFIQPHAARS